jgi:hypothetical protein
MTEVHQAGHRRAAPPLSAAMPGDSAGPVVPVVPEVPPDRCSSRSCGGLDPRPAHSRLVVYGLLGALADALVRLTERRALAWR